MQKNNETGQGTQPLKPIEGFYPPYQIEIKSELDFPANPLEIQISNTLISTNHIPIFSILNGIALGIGENAKEPGPKLFYDMENQSRRPTGRSRVMTVDEKLRRFSIYGYPKLGSLFSVFHGIEELERAEADKIGLHSSAVFDRDLNVIHLLIGGSGVGKTSYAFLLGELFPERFHFIGDEWNALDLNSRTVSIESPVFGETKNPYLKGRFSEAMTSTRFYSPEGKNYWLNSIQAEAALGRIVILNNIPNEESNENTMYEIHKNIPFMGIDFASCQNTTNTYLILKEKIKRIKEKLDHAYIQSTAVHVSEEPQTYMQNLDLIREIIE